MKHSIQRIFLGLIGVICLTTCLPVLLYSQSSLEITLEDIYRHHRFSAEDLRGLNSMRDGEHYSVRKLNRIEKYSYRTGGKVEILFDASDFPEIKGFSEYRFNTTENKILIETAREKIYRHSYKAVYYVFDLHKGTLIPVSTRGKQQLGDFSPCGSRVAFVRDNNLFVRDLQQEEEIQVTFDGVKNRVINGAPDWVYEEEFKFSKGFYWSPDGKKIAFYRFDESHVKQFHMTMYGTLYPEKYEFKYPKAGEENSVVSILVYDLESGITTVMDTGEETDQYIPRIQWTYDPNILSILRLNRLQNRLDIIHADAVSGHSEVVYEEENQWYISLCIQKESDHPVTYLSDRESMILLSERSGYYHFYHYNYKTGVLRPVTSGNYDVHELIGFDRERKVLYYTSHEESTIERHVYSVRLDGKNKKKISTTPGTNTASFSATYRYYILTQSSANSPPYITLHNRKGKLIRVLVDNERLKKTMESYGFVKTEFLTVPTPSGQELNAWMIKPADFDPLKEYPLFVYVYGGPQSQLVTDSWGRRGPWFQMLVQKGYIVACVDNRGTDGRGEAFRKATYLTLGKLETIDQLEVARWFGSQDYIDKSRMGIFGWSYGGFMTSLCMTKGEGTFRMGIAVAPVTNWRYYDSIYTERFMRTPQENAEGYDRNSPIHFAAGLQGKLLLIHGSGDDNVHFQNSMDFAEALVQADKQFEMQFYTNKNHGIRGGNTTFHLHRRMTDFILENL